MDNETITPPGYSKIPTAKLPESVCLQIDQFLANFSTPLILDGTLAGSGSFIKCGNKHGILTAHHVVRNPQHRSRIFDFSAGSKQQLSLSVINRRGHSFALPMWSLSCVDVGIPADASTGPDLSVILFPEVRVGEIMARKSFIDVSIQREKRIAKCNAPDGLWCATGYPQYYQRVSESTAGGARSTYLPMITVYTNVANRSQRGGFDFFHVAVNKLQVRRTTETLGSVEPPSTCGGMSGGGIWKLPLTMTNGERIPKIVFDQTLLAGVAFYETYNEQGKLKELRCHGPRSIYDKVYEAIMSRS